MGNGSKVYVERMFQCESEALFDWLTKPELIAQWFGPEGFSIEKVKSTLEEGGSYQIELRKGENIVFEIRGKYLKLQRPQIIEFTYNYHGLESPPPPSVVQFKISATESGDSMLSMVQAFKVETPDFATRSKAWEYMLERLSQLA